MNHPPKGLSRRPNQKRRPTPKRRGYILRDIDDNIQGFVSDEQINNFLSKVHYFKSLDEYKEWNKDNTYISIFDEDVLNKHIKIPNCKFVYHGENLFIDRFI